MIFNGNPSNIILSRRTSLVVPATGVTIATSFPASAFNKLDLPEFGFPAKTRVRPSLSKEPCCAFDKTEDRSFVSLSKRANKEASFKKSISSSGKSIAAST